MIDTYSAFNYGHTVTTDNNLLNFDEGSGEALATLNSGSYTLGDYVDEVARAMNEAGSLTYEATIDRATGKIIISGSGTFSLLLASGSNVESAPFALMGFTTSFDLTGQSSYTGDSRSGSVFLPQFFLQKYVDFEDSQESLNVSVNRSASGMVEVVKFGDVNFMSCDISYITNITGQSVIKDNTTGVEDARDFMKYCITKAPIEFVKDIDMPDNYVKCFLVSSSSSKDGTGFVLKELYARGLAGYYDLPKLRFQRIIE